MGKEDALEESEERFKTLFHSAPDAIAIGDMKGVITEVNDATLKLSGYTRDELVGKHFSKLPSFRARELPRYIKIFNTLLRGRIPEPFEIPLLKKDGTTDWAEVHLGFLESGGKRVGIQAILRNISDRKIIEEELRESEARYRSLAENAADILLTIDLEGRFTYFSKEYDEDTGYTAEELIGKNIGDILTLQSKLKAFRRLARWINGEREFSPMMLWVETKKGETLPFEINDSPILVDRKLTGMMIVARNVEERYKMEERNRRSEERLKILFENAPDAIFLGDRKGNIVDSNRTAENLLGYSRGELIGKNLLTSGDIPRNQITKVTRELARTVLGQPRGPFEFTINRKDGDQITVEVSTFPVKIEDRSLILGIARDVSERKKIQDTLRESEEKFRNWIENAPVGILNIDLVGYITYINNKFEEETGYSREEVIGKNFLELGLVSDETADLLVERMRDRLSGAPAQRMEVLVNHRDGGTKWVEIEGRVLEDEGSPTGLQLIATDINEKVEYRGKLESLVHEQTQRLEESEGRFRSLSTKSLDAIIEVDLRGRISYASPSAEEISGYSIEEILGMPFVEFLPPEELPRVAQAFTQGIESGELETLYSFKIKRKDGTQVYAEVNVSPLFRDDEVSGFQTVIRNITQRLREEEELRDTERFLAAGKIASVLAQDLNDPLQTIKNALSQIEEAPEKADEIRESMTEAVDYAGQLLDDLHRFIEDSPTQISNVSLGALLRETLNEFPIPESVELKMEIGSGVEEVLLDPSKIRRVLVNLVRNAVEAMPDGGELKISVERDRENAAIKVADTGTGIPEFLQQDVFKTFVTTKETGMGLGLPYSKQAIESHGGTISVESEMGEGSTFTIRLPIEGAGLHRRRGKGPL